jgi:hypothetical protein
MADDQAAGTRADAVNIKSLIVCALESRGGKARFVTELSAAVARSAVSQERLESVLAELSGAGLIMVRDHFCADPHLAAVDLRIAAVVRLESDTDAQMKAIRAIDEAWDKWLAEYLANHRCT